MTIETVDIIFYPGFVVVVASCFYHFALLSIFNLAVFMLLHLKGKKVEEKKIDRNNIESV